MKRIAIVGAGISGLTAAWLLSRRHQVVVYEAESYIGGHTHTVSVSREHGDYQVDTGFIVFNDRTYPGFERLLSQLGIGRQPTSMGFAVSCAATGLEYSGDGIGGFFAQKRNLLSARHWRLLQDIMRFNREAPALLESEDVDMTLAEYLRRGGYSEGFLRHYILPMGSAIWSCGERQIGEFPATFFVRFFHNHGLLSLTNRPQWYVIPGGSARYVEALVSRCSADFRTGTPVRAVRRNGETVSVFTDDQGAEEFDEVVMACHADQALALLADADAGERHLLAGIGWQENSVVLHTDESLLPRHKRVWSSWNALLPKEPGDRVRVTYDMNILQGIRSPETFCVTLNADDAIAADKVIGRWTFFHPLFTPSGLSARADINADNGRRHTWFCGAWCRYGFHEDGVVSAQRVARAFGEEL